MTVHEPKEPAVGGRERQEPDRRAEREKGVRRREERKREIHPEKGGFREGR